MSRISRQVIGRTVVRVRAMDLAQEDRLANELF